MTLTTAVTQQTEIVADPRAARVARVSAAVAAVDVRLSLLNLVALFFMFLGRLPAYLVNAVVWCTVAMGEGYRQVRPKPSEEPGR